MDCGLVSVIIPTRNRCRFLSKAIESVSMQTYPEIEVIVTDDASTDDTVGFLRDLRFRGGPVRVIRNETAIGGAASRNLGVSMAKGRWIAFLDDDDEWLPEKIITQAQLMCKNSAVSAVSCSYLVRKPSGALQTVRVREIIDEQLMLSGNFMGGASGCFTSREKLIQVGAFDPYLRSGQDYDLWIRLWDKGRIAVTDRPLIIYGAHRGDRISLNVRMAYCGNRRVYRRYKYRMTQTTRWKILSELLYTRTAIYKGPIFSQIRRFWMVLQIAGAKRCASCLWRFVTARQKTMRENDKVCKTTMKKID